MKLFRILQESFFKEILLKSGINFVFRMIAMLLSFITAWYIGHFFGEAVYGSYSLSLTILQISVMIFGLGVPNVIYAFSADLNEYQLKGLLVKIIRFFLALGVLSIFIFLLGSKFISVDFFKKPGLYHYFVVIGFAIPFFVLHEVVSNYFIIIKKQFLYSLLYFVLPNTFFLFFLLGTYKYKLDSYFTFYSYVLALIITTFIGLFKIFFRNLKTSQSEISNQKILKKSTPMMIGGLFMILLNWTDILMLGFYETEANIGIYNAAFKVGSLALFFVATMNVVLTPKISQLYYNGSFLELKKNINAATQIVIALTLPLAFFLIFFSSFILNFFGSSFTKGATTLILITLGSLASALTGNVDQILNMTNHEKISRNIFLVGFLINLFLNLFLIPNYGIEGAAFSSLLTNVVINIIFVIIIKIKLGFYTFI